MDMTQVQIMVASRKQVMANKKNAKKGGVKTEIGKAKSKMNALKHSLLSEAVLLPGEDGEVLANVIAGLNNELRPQGQLECLLVDIIISCIWRLKRVTEAKTSQILKYYEKRNLDITTNHSPTKRWAVTSLFTSDFINSALRYETTIERKPYRALNTLIELRMLRANNKEIHVIDSARKMLN
jgi:hypothetical protein